MEKASNPSGPLRELSFHQHTRLPIPPSSLAIPPDPVRTYHNQNQDLRTFPMKRFGKVLRSIAAARLQLDAVRDILDCFA